MPRPTRHRLELEHVERLADGADTSITSSNPSPSDGSRSNHPVPGLSARSAREAHAVHVDAPHVHGPEERESISA